MLPRRVRPSLLPKSMLALIQRVTEAKVVVDGETVGAIGSGRFPMTPAR